MRCLAILVAVWVGVPAFADVAVFSCSVGQRELSVSADEHGVQYAFGPKNEPELELSNTLEENGFSPWPGIGRSLFESITFTNNGFSYDVYWSLDRLDPESVLQGGVVISDGGDVETTLLCDPGSVDAPFFTLGDHLADMGLCLDPETRVWGACAQ